MHDYSGNNLERTEIISTECNTLKSVKITWNLKKNVALKVSYKSINPIKCLFSLDDFNQNCFKNFKE